MVSTFEVSQLDKLTEVNIAQLANKSSIYVTYVVLKFFKYTDLSDIQ